MGAPRGTLGLRDSRSPAFWTAVASRLSGDGPSRKVRGHNGDLCRRLAAERGVMADT